MRIILLLFIVLLTVFGCKENTDIIKLPNSESEYTLLKRGTGIKPFTGDYVQYSMVVFGNDSIMISDLRDTLNWATVRVSEIGKNIRPLDEMLFSLNVGDSIVMHLTNIEGSKPMNNIHTISYFVKLERIFDEQTWQIHNADVKADQIDKLTKDLLADYHTGNLDDDLIKVRGEMTYYLIERGRGPKVMRNDQVTVEFHGIIAETGKEFDSSFRRGREFRFNIGRNEVIRAWEDAMHFLYEGDKAILFVPWQLGYGVEGMPPVIPEKADLVFYMEVLSRRPVK